MIPDNEVRLTQMTKTAGCAAKIGPGTLAGVLENLPKADDPNLMVGIETSDDGAVYRVNDELALIQTLDFFTPVVDDPYTFGQVAAANALSDIYAMGGEPKVALNIVAWPNCVNPAFLGKILEGGASKVAEAGAVLAGGHSVQDDEPKYGLSVTGFVPVSYTHLRAHENTAVKADMASAEAKEEVIRVMTSLNRTAKRVIEQFDVHSCTDVTGFGLAGHSAEMAEGSGVTLEIHMSQLPIQKEAPDLAKMGLIPAGAYRNRAFVEHKVDFGDTEEFLCDIFCDPQTSGGLLVSVTPEDGEKIAAGLREAGLETAFAVIGCVKELEDKFVKLR